MSVVNVKRDKTETFHLNDSLSKHVAVVSLVLPGGSRADAMVRIGTSADTFMTLTYRVFSLAAEEIQKAYYQVPPDA